MGRRLVILSATKCLVLSVPVHVWKVARYTCSSPLYVGECDNFIDGGAVYKNPSIFAFSAIREAYRLQSICLSGVLSIGDGRMPGVALGKLDKTSFYTHFYSSSAVREGGGGGGGGGGEGERERERERERLGVQWDASSELILGSTVHPRLSEPQCVLAYLNPSASSLIRTPVRPRLSEPLWPSSKITLFR